MNCRPPLGSNAPHIVGVLTASLLLLGSSARADESAGGPPVIVPMGLSMHLTATGTAQRRSLVLILHRSSLPPTTVERRWIAKGLCKKP